MESKVTITLEEYTALIRQAEKIGAVERLIRKTNYVSCGDIKAILDIEETEKENDNETV